MLSAHAVSTVLDFAFISVSMAEAALKTAQICAAGSLNFERRVINFQPIRVDPRTRIDPTRQ